jgi:hypothetical protein
MTRPALIFGSLGALLIGVGAAGTWAFSQRSHDRAAAAFLRAEAVAQSGDYNVARNAYLAVVNSTSPLVGEARARLFDLTLAAGARVEAAHHLRKLEELVGTDDLRVRTRRSVLSLHQSTGDGPPPTPRPLR